MHTTRRGESNAFHTGPGLRVDGAGRWAVVRPNAAVREELRAPALASGLSAVLAIGLLWLVHGALIDDAYITLSYARNLAQHLHWGLIPQETANSATAPLNVLLIAAATAVVGVVGKGTFVGFGVVFVGAAAALGWWWGRIAQTLALPWFAVGLGVGAVLLNPFVLSASGMEVLLSAAVLTGLLAASTRNRPVAFGVLAGLAVLVRLDLAVFVVALALEAVLSRRMPLAAIGRAALASGVIALPWYLFSWVYLGSAIPDTYVIKTLEGSFGGWTFAGGPAFYLRRFPAATVAGFAGFGLGLAAVAMWVTRRGRVRFAPVAALGLGAIAYYGAYSILGVPPYQWYFVPDIVALTSAFVILASAARRRRAVLAGAAAVVVLAGAAVDAAQGLPWRGPVIFGNWATPTEYARAGTDLGRRVGGGTVTAPPEIGTLAYFCDCALVDAFSDRGRVVPVIDERIRNSGLLGRQLLKLNYLWLDRSQRPRPAEFQLRWESGPGPGGGDSWTTTSPAKGTNHLHLVGPADGGGVR